MNSKELGYQVSILEFKLKALTDKIPEVYIVGSGKVARVITENNNIYIIGEEAANDTYLRGYSDGVRAGVDAYNKFIGYAIVKKSRANYVMGLFNEDRDSLVWAIDACGFKNCEVVKVYEENNKYFMKKEKDFIEL